MTYRESGSNSCIVFSKCNTSYIHNDYVIFWLRYINLFVVKSFTKIVTPLKRCAFEILFNIFFKGFVQQKWYSQWKPLLSYGICIIKWSELLCIYGNELYGAAKPFINRRISLIHSFRCIGFPIYRYMGWIVPSQPLLWLVTPVPPPRVADT